MSIQVRLEDLDAELGRRGYAAYLLTVSEDGRPHCVAGPVAWDGEDLVVHAGSTSSRNAHARGRVTVVSPPAPSEGEQDPGSMGPRGLLGGYTLIVDAEADAGTPPTAAGMLRLRPTHAVLHRPAPSPDGTGAHDCVHVFDADAAG